MEKKIVGIFVCTLLIAATALPVVGNIHIDNTKLMKNFVDSTNNLPISTLKTLSSFENVTPENEWTWNYNNAVNSSHNCVCMTPLVVELDNNLTNGSEIIFTSFHRLNR